MKSYPAFSVPLMPAALNMHCSFVCMTCWFRNSQFWNYVKLTLANEADNTHLSNKPRENRSTSAAFAIALRLPIRIRFVTPLMVKLTLSKCWNCMVKFVAYVYMCAKCIFYRVKFSTFSAVTRMLQMSLVLSGFLKSVPMPLRCIFAEEGAFSPLQCL